MYICMIVSKCSKWQLAMWACAEQLSSYSTGQNFLQNFLNLMEFYKKLHSAVQQEIVVLQEDFAGSSQLDHSFSTHYGMVVHGLKTESIYIPKKQHYFKYIQLGTVSCSGNLSFLYCNGHLNNKYSTINSHRGTYLTLCLLHPDMPCVASIKSLD